MKNTKDFKHYLRKKKLNNSLIIIIQISILIVGILLWEILANLGAIDVFFLSCPSRIITTLKDLYINGNLMYHIGISLYEAIIGFLISTIGGTIIAMFLWWNTTMRKIFEPYLIVLNSLPKIALGPIIIIWVGVGIKAIVCMDILIMIIVTIISMLNSFINCDKNKILLLKSIGAKKHQILFKLILPNSVPDFMNIIKINLGMTWIGTIMGEYLVSKAGIGYLIVYGKQIFNLDLVMASTIILCILTALMYLFTILIERLFIKIKNNKINNN